MTDTAQHAPRPWRHLLRLSNRRQRWRTLSWGGLNAALIVMMLAAYDSAYPDQSSADAMIALISSNAAFTVLMGQPQDLTQAGGFVAWRLSLMPLLIAVWALLTTTMLLRGDEDSNRWELIVSRGISRMSATALVVGSVAMQLVLMFVMMAAGAVAYGVDVGDSVHFSAAYMMPAAVFIGVGALCAQLFDSRRGAAAVAGGLAAAAALVRMLVDGVSNDLALQWTSPFGWYFIAEPFADPQWGPIVVGVIVALALCTAAVALARTRDLRGAALPNRPQRGSSMRWLSSPGLAAARQQQWTIFWWMVGIAAYAVIIGVISRDFADFLTSQEGFADLAAILSPVTSAINTYFGLINSIMMVVLVVFAVLQFGSIAEDEINGRLDLVLSRSVGRLRWLLERVAVIAAAVVLLAAVLALGTWAGAVANGVDVALVDMIRGSVNMLWVTMLFMGLASLMYGLSPRNVVPITMGIVLVTFLWNIVGELLEAPDLLLQLSPFYFVEPVPAADADIASSVAMAVAGLALLAIGLWRFERRDITPG